MAMKSLYLRPPAGMREISQGADDPPQHRPVTNALALRSHRNP